MRCAGATTTNRPDIAKAEDAIDALLDALRRATAERQEEKYDPGARIVATPYRHTAPADIPPRGDARLLWGPDVVEIALRDAIRRLGELLLELGGDIDSISLRL
jgi:hypothetical protein